MLISTAPTAPVTGRDFARQRILLGIPVGTMARELGLKHEAYAAQERSVAAMSDEQAVRWRLALASCATARAASLAHQGFALSDLVAAQRQAFRAVLLAK